MACGDRVGVDRCGPACQRIALITKVASMMFRSFTICSVVTLCSAVMAMPPQSADLLPREGHAHAGEAPMVPPPGVAVRLPVEAPAAGVVDLKFSEMFKMPVGPQGLEPSARLLSLHGKPVRLIGYMVDTESRAPGTLILAPLPVSNGHEDESLADDLPATAVFVHLSGMAAQQTVRSMRGLIQLTGTLQVGAADEADGRVSAIRLRVDESTSRLLTGEPANVASR